MYSYVKVVTLLCLNDITYFKTSINNIININLPPTKVLPIATNRMFFLSFMTKIFKIIRTRANKSEMNPTIAVALTGSKKSVQFKKKYCIIIIVKC